jgi:hypothetical protein
MSSHAENDVAELQSRLRSEKEYAAKQGPDWVKRHEKEFASLAKGTVVAINCRTGEYVMASSRLELIEKFERKFGKEVGYVHEIGGGIFVGWGGGIA